MAGKKYCREKIFQMFRVYKCLWCGETMKYFTDIKGKFSKGSVHELFAPWL